MTKKRIRKWNGSLRNRLLLVLLFGTLLAGAVYLLTRTAINSYISNSYLAEENKQNREKEYLRELQDYIIEENLSSKDTKKLTSWVRRNRYVYLLVYKDDELFFSSDDAETPEGGKGDPLSGGITVDYPTRDKLIENAKNNGLYPLTMSDGTLFASLADFTEYFYYDLSNLVSLLFAMLAIGFVMVLYFHRITRRITHLADDVTLVSGGDMHHVIRAEGGDEISALSRNVEQMRSSILENLEKERRAVDANVELITSMSHDIRTPLTVLLGYLDVMKMRTGDETMQSYLQASENTAMRLKDLSDDLFQYFLVFGKDNELNLQPYDAETLIGQLFSEHILLLQENGYTVRTEGAFTGPMTITVDAPKMMRIIDNLFSNFTKYAEKSEPILLKITPSETSIWLHFENKVIKTPTHAESNHIGLRTCKKIADAMHLAFSFEQRGDLYVTYLNIPVTKTEETGK